jgi:iron transport multicopper oxidase
VDAGWAFGTVTVGQSAEATVTLANLGDAPMTFTKSKPPVNDDVAIVAGLDEGSTIAPGQSRDVTLRWTPSAAGTLATAWTLNAADGSGVHEVPVTGTAVDPPPPAVVVTPPPVVAADTPSPVVVQTPPAVTPPSVGRVDGGGSVVTPTKVRSGLRVTTARLSRDDRTLAVRGRVVAGVRGPVGVTLRAKVGNRFVTVATGTVLTGRSTYGFSITLPKTIKKWTRIELTVRFPGSATVAPAAAVLVLVRGR